MKDVRIDSEGQLRCWKCGGKSFENKRTFRAKAVGGTAAVLTLGVAGAAAPLATKKKLRCQACGEYNQVGNAKPYVPDAGSPAAAPSVPAVGSGPQTASLVSLPDAEANLAAALADAKLDTYTGYGTRVVRSGDSFEFSHNKVTSMARGTKSSTVRFDDITAVRSEAPTLVVNGWLKILVDGETPPPLNAKAGTPPSGGNVVAFTYQRRNELMELATVVAAIVARNRAAADAAEPAGEKEGVEPQVPSELASPSVADRLRHLDELREQGLVTDDEYATKRAEILGAL